MDYNTTQAVANATPLSDIWWAFGLAVLVVFLVYSAILVYHWRKFSLNRLATIMATILYVVVSAILITAVIMSIIGI